MPRKRATPGDLSGLCVRCLRRIGKEKPSYLVQTPGGVLGGPYHAWCANRVVEAARKEGLPGADVWQQQQLPIEPGREETLPW